MATYIDVRVALLVGSDGKYSAYEEKNVDWGMMEDNIGEWRGTKFFDPPASRKYILTAQVELPEIIELAATVEKASP